MSRKGKGVLMESVEDTKLRLKHHSLMQDYYELQKEAKVMRSRMDSAKHRKLTLAAEVRFLRRRYKNLMGAKSMNLAEEQTQQLKPANQAKTLKEQPTRRKLAIQHGLPPVPERKSKKKRYSGKEVATSTASPAMHSHHSHLKELYGGNKTPSQSFTPVTSLGHEGWMNMRKPNFNWNPNVFGLNLNGKDKLHVQSDTTLNRCFPGFDLNQDSVPVRKDAPLPNRALIFDLNEVSTGDDDFQSNVEPMNMDEAKKSLIRGLNDEQPDLMLSICRDSGEGSSRVGKRKISWQDPVALRV